LTALLLHLATWSDANIALVAAAVEHAALTENVLAPIFQRLATDPEFLEVATRLSNLAPPEDPTPAAADLPPTDASSKTRKD
jgi:hypothetical protein